MVEVINCAPDPHIGESKTVNFLRHRLQGFPGFLLTNYYLPDNTASLEIDLVFIGRYGVLLLEVKDWYGQIVADDIHWQQGNRAPVSSPITSIDRKCKVMHGQLQTQGLGRVSVNGLVVLVKGTQLLRISDRRKDRVFGLDDQLIQALTTDQFQFSKRPPLDRNWIKQVKDTIVRNHVNPERTFIGKYQILRQIQGTPGLTEYAAQHTELTNRRARIKAYQVLEIESQKQLAEQVRHFRRDIEALEEAGPHPNLVRAYEFFKDEHSDEFYYLVLEWVRGEPLSDLLDRSESPPLAVQIGWIQQVASALTHLHRRKIVHRNITPENIYLTEDNTIKLGNFDLAKVPALGKTISVTGVPLVQTRYTAPEIFTKPQEVDQRADLYALGAVWFDLLVPQAAQKAINPAHLETADIPEEVQEVASRMLSERRVDRYQDADELLQDLEMLVALLD